jgi:hypothetical protein
MVVVILGGQPYRAIQGANNRPMKVVVMAWMRMGVQTMALWRSDGPNGKTATATVVATTGEPSLVVAAVICAGDSAGRASLREKVLWSNPGLLLKPSCDMMVARRSAAMCKEEAGGNSSTGRITTAAHEEEPYPSGGARSVKRSQIRQEEPDQSGGARSVRGRGWNSAGAKSNKMARHGHKNVVRKAH